MATSTNIKLIQKRYEETRRRITRFGNKFNISDREIIESLAEEIEQYRDKIRKQEEYIEELRRKEIIFNVKEENIELKEIQNVEDDEIKQIETTNIFADGKLIQSITKYHYEDK